MVLTDKIQQYIQKLPVSSQSEVLEFIQYLIEKAERERGQRDELEWSNLSLASAISGMEEEDTSAYSISDLKVEFS